VHDQSAPAPTSDRYTDSRFDDRRYGVLRARLGHLCRHRPLNAHSRVSDGVELLRSLTHRPSSSRSSLPWFCVDSTMVMAHWSASRPTLSADSSRCGTQMLDWYFVSVVLTTSRMHSSAYIGCECPKGLFSRSPCRLIGLSMAMPHSTYGCSHRSPTSPLDKDCGLLHLTIYSFLSSDCLLLDVAPSLSPALAHGTTYQSTSPQHHLCSPSEND